MKLPTELDPAHARLLRNPDFALFLKRLAKHRSALFEAGESDTEPHTIFERRGKRKMLQILLDEGSRESIFRDTSK